MQLEEGVGNVSAFDAARSELLIPASQMWGRRLSAGVIILGGLLALAGPAIANSPTGAQAIYRYLWPHLVPAIVALGVAIFVGLRARASGDWAVGFFGLALGLGAGFVAQFGYPLMAAVETSVVAGGAITLGAVSGLARERAAIVTRRTHVDEAIWVPSKAGPATCLAGSGVAIVAIAVHWQFTGPYAGMGWDSLRFSLPLLCGPGAVAAIAIASIRQPGRIGQGAWGVAVGLGIATSCFFLQRTTSILEGLASPHLPWVAAELVH